MKNLMKLMCVVLVLIMTICLFGCGKGSDGLSEHTNETSLFIGTWKGSDHDGENVVHYLIFDNDGYWKVYMNYKTLEKAIRQLPDQLVSFKIFRQLQNSGQTGCFFEYVKNDGESRYADVFSLDDQGYLTTQDNKDVHFVQVSEYSGEPDETIVEESKDLFDRAREKALQKK